MRTLTVQQVAALDGATIVDVREPDEVAAMSVPGAVTMPMSTLMDHLDELPEGTLHILCHSGGRSARVTAYLDEHGYDAINVDGGITAWHAAGLPTTASAG